MWSNTDDWQIGATCKVSLYDDSGRRPNVIKFVKLYHFFKYDIIKAVLQELQEAGANTGFWLADR